MGEKSGFKKGLSERNEEIFNKHKNRITVKELTVQYYLTESSIRRIIREEKNKE